jgi:DNA-binding response OmpR family regulator
MHGLRVLVVEDTLLVAEMIEDELQEIGCDVVGPVPRLAQALALAKTERLDGALLDVNLAGEYTFPVAEVLTERNVPFAFLTGYGDAGLPPAFRSIPRLTKPFAFSDLETLIATKFVKVN